MPDHRVERSWLQEVFVIVFLGCWSLAGLAVTAYFIVLGLSV